LKYWKSGKILHRLKLVCGQLGDKTGFKKRIERLGGAAKFQVGLRVRVRVSARFRNQYCCCPVLYRPVGMSLRLLATLKMVGVYLRPIWVGFYMPTLCKHICFTFQAPPCVLFCHCLSSFQRCQHAESVRGGISGVRVVRGNELCFGRIARSHLHGCDGFRNGMLLPADDLPGLQHM